MYTKKNARVTFKSNRRSGYRRGSSNYSNGRTRNKGNVSQLYNKYLKLAKEAFTSGDRIQSEYYYQFTDHYYRLMVELGINIDDGEINLENKTEEKKVIKESDNEIEKNQEQDNENTSDSNDEEVNEDDNNVESIESIPFIAEPAKKKRARTTK